MRRFSLLPVRLGLLCCLSSVLLLNGCADQQAKAKVWWASTGKASAQATISLIASEAAQIAEKTVYSKGLDASDVVLKNFNVQGFGDGLRTLETGLTPAAIGQIPDFVMRLRQIWLPGQTHYTDLAANVGVLIQQQTAKLEAQEGHPLSSDEVKAVIEGVIKGLQTPPTALVGP